MPGHITGIGMHEKSPACDGAFFVVWFRGKPGY